MPGSAIVGVAKCRLCAKIFQGPSALLLGNGDQSSNIRTQKFLESLGKHVSDDHPPHAQHCQVKSAEYLGMLLLGWFEITDPALEDQQNFLRWSTHQATLKGGYTKDGLEQAATLYAQQITDAIERNATSPISVVMRGVIATQCEKVVLEVMNMMRDQLQEPDAYFIEPETPRVQA